MSEETSAELQDAFHKVSWKKTILCVQLKLLQFMADGSAKSAVLMSGKPGCFIAGADIRVRMRTLTWVPFLLSYEMFLSK